MADLLNRSPNRLLGRLRGRLPRILTRYTAGSVIAGVVSEVTLLTAYGTGLLGPGQASAAGWASGAVVNYVLNRWWVWRRRGVPKPVREVLAYWLTALAGLGISTWATEAAGRFAAHLAEGPRLAVVGAVFLGVYGLLFVAKFVLFHYFIFADKSRSEAGSGAGAGADRRSRHQVPSTTRE
ncbi:GtrA family protein [Nonomuraea sp. K274]|uniref:GtrA family protein n=1 Tax=Nonomuraea cypriaca TaxID=1187855 RepID=A0A931EYB7_9ACTN|nr:GtrA family protein [Nonomuraea cypriaca]MBF8185046.1 GtrA family protein [Nonomuraea cypriaca]